MKELIDKLKRDKCLKSDEYKVLLSALNDKDIDYLHECARNVSNKHFGNKIFIRGLIEISNYCKNDCYYCGIRLSNCNVNRYRLTKEEILNSCKAGYDLGFKTFVLQSGEDNYYTKDYMCEIIREIHSLYPDCAITLSLGEKDFDTYKAYYDAGATRYLLRHETINKDHYKSLHPSNQNIDSRTRCLRYLKEIGYQVGSGIMVGSPNQTIDNIIEDIIFLNQIKPEMIGIGPFLPHVDTPFKNKEKGDLTTTTILLSILRLMHPNALIPSTTALSSLADDGREMGILAGANVVMPNLSPFEFRKDYSLYNNKKYQNEESAQSLNMLQKQLEKIGYAISYDRGDYQGE